MLPHPLGVSVACQHSPPWTTKHAFLKSPRPRLSSFTGCFWKAILEGPNQKTDLKVNLLIDGVLRRTIYKRPLIALPIYLSLYRGAYLAHTIRPCLWVESQDRLDAFRLWSVWWPETALSEPGLTKKQYVVRWEARGGGEEELKLFSITSTWRTAWCVQFNGKAL